MDRQDVTKSNYDDIRKAEMERKQVEAIRSMDFGEWFIGEDGKPNRALAGFLLFGMIVGAAVLEWYAVTNGWPYLRQRVLFWSVTWGLPLGLFGGMAVGIAGYKIFRIFKR